VQLRSVSWVQPEFGFQPKPPPPPRTSRRCHHRHSSKTLPLLSPATPAATPPTLSHPARLCLPYIVHGIGTRPGVQIKCCCCVHFPRKVPLAAWKTAGCTESLATDGCPTGSHIPTSVRPHCWRGVKFAVGPLQRRCQICSGDQSRILFCSRQKVKRPGTGTLYFLNVVPTSGLVICWYCCYSMSHIMFCSRQKEIRLGAGSLYFLSLVLTPLCFSLALQPLKVLSSGHYPPLLFSSRWVICPACNFGHVKK